MSITEHVDWAFAQRVLCDPSAERTRRDTAAELLLVGLTLAADDEPPVISDAIVAVLGNHLAGMTPPKIRRGLTRLERDGLITRVDAGYWLTVTEPAR